MYTFLISLALFTAFMLVLVILAQNSKGGGLSSQFGGSGASNIIGVKKTGDLLERLTWGFIVAIMVIALSSSMVDPNGAGPAEDILDQVKPQQSGSSLEVTPNTNTTPAQDSSSK
jgi:preprotein translocase subunit SecG